MRANSGGRCANKAGRLLVEALAQVDAVFQIYLHGAQHSRPPSQFPYEASRASGVSRQPYSAIETKVRPSSSARTPSSPLTHRWRVRTRRLERFGEHCRILARGRMGSVLVEFFDSYRVVTSRNYVRRLDSLPSVRHLWNLTCHPHYE